MDVRKAIRIIRDSPLSQVANRLVPLLQSSIRLVANPIPPSALTRGGSRLGGLPDMPLNVEWPQSKNGPMSFIAQIDLRDCARIIPNSPLPSKGWLCFFYDTTAQAWGFDPNDFQTWRAIYFDSDTAELCRRQGNVESVGRIFKPLVVEMRADLTLPAPGDDQIDIPIDLNDEQATEAYLDLRDAIAYQTDMFSHRMLGHPDQMQGEMRLESQLASNGIYCGKSVDFSVPRVKQLARSAKDWLFLLQIDSDEERAGWMWGDAGMLYLWIRNSDLRVLAFDRTWVILQCG